MQMKYPSMHQNKATKLQLQYFTQSFFFCSDMGLLKTSNSTLISFKFQNNNITLRKPENKAGNCFFLPCFFERRTMKSFRVWSCNPVC